MNVLFIGGTGQISLSCVEVAVAAGHRVTVFNRGHADKLLPAGVESVVGDMKDAAAEYTAALAGAEMGGVNPGLIQLKIVDLNAAAAAPAAASTGAAAPPAAAPVPSPTNKAKP